MLKNVFLAAILSVSALISNAASAAGFDLNKAAQVLAENKDLDTELKAAKILITYADLMAYFTGELTADSEASVREVLRQSEELLRTNRGTTDPELKEALALLHSQIVQLAEITTNTNHTLQAVGTQVTSLNKATTRFPQAKFTATLSLLIGLTQETVATHSNYAKDIAQYAVLVSQESQSADSLRALSEQRQQVAKYSFAEISQRFTQISSVLKMMYDL